MLTSILKNTLRKHIFKMSVRLKAFKAASRLREAFGYLRCNELNHSKGTYHSMDSVCLAQEKIDDDLTLIHYHLREQKCSNKEIDFAGGLHELRVLRDNLEEHTKETFQNSFNSRVKVLLQTGVPMLEAKFKAYLELEKTELTEFISKSYFIEKP